MWVCGNKKGGYRIASLVSSGQFQRDVEWRCPKRDGARRNQVDAGPCVLRDRRDVDVPGTLDDDLVAQFLLFERRYGFLHLVERHVVEHDDVSARPRCFDGVGDRRDLDLDLLRERRGLLVLPDHGLDVAEVGEVVVLEQDHVIEVPAMRVATADGDSPFLHNPQARHRLARGRDPAPEVHPLRVDDGLELARARRDAAEVHEQVERGPLGEQDGAHGAGHHRERIALDDRVAVLLRRDHLAADDAVNHLDLDEAANDALLLRDDRRLALGLLGDQGSRDVLEMHVFQQEVSDLRLDGEQV